MSQSASNIITPDHWAFSFLKPSQLPGEYNNNNNNNNSTNLNRA